MADYREISQVYAQEGIKAALLINSGAAVTILTQVSSLIEKQKQDIVLCPMIFWSVGIALSTILWLGAFLSTRYVDKAHQEEKNGNLEKNNKNITISNRWMLFAIGGFVASVAAFMIGGIILARNLFVMN
ncbi:Na+/melibiose symporter-like transporter [Agrobacterium vitis]|nr:Na+/melibiose symporter-like transporter [Agrobacterium vitis]MBE1438188.1 Na+/melibiose symporter-like transporter [Agrobacterium vitis]